MSGASDYSPHVSNYAKMTPSKKVESRQLGQRKASKDPYWKVILDGHMAAFRLSFDRLKHSPLATWMTMIVIAIALALPTSFFSAAGYLQSIAGTWHQHVQISLYLDQNLSHQQQNELVVAVNQLEDVGEVRLISADEGLKLFQSQTGFAEVIGQLPYNPIPAVIEVTPATHAQQTQYLEKLVANLGKMPGVDSAQLDRDWVERLYSVINLVDRISVVLGLALAIAVLLTIGNTMRLILKKYQKEIELMNLLGAKKTYIRRPYIYMGLLYGLGGALLAWCLLALALAMLHGPLVQLAGIYHLPMSYHILPMDILPGLLITGCLLGATGAWLTVNRDIYAI